MKKIFFLFFLFCQLLSGGQIHLYKKETTMIPMRDGVKLSADIYFPEGKGTFPVILVRTPYDNAPLVDKGLFFIGPPGIGKTHLSVALLKHAVKDKGATGLFCDVPELLKKLLERSRL